MTAKIVALAAAVLLGTTAFASAAQTTQARHHHARVAPNGALYDQQQRGYDPYAGTYYDGWVPYGSGRMPDPYAGTYYDGVAPY